MPDYLENPNPQTWPEISYSGPNPVVPPAGAPQVTPADVVIDLVESTIVAGVSDSAPGTPPSGFLRWYPGDVPAGALWLSPWIDMALAKLPGAQLYRTAELVLRASAGTGNARIEWSDEGVNVRSGPPAGPWPVAAGPWVQPLPVAVVAAQARVRIDAAAALTLDGPVTLILRS
jgi:hypothetical protein